MNHRSSGYQPDALTNCAMLRKRQMWESNPLKKTVLQAAAAPYRVSAKTSRKGIEPISCASETPVLSVTLPGQTRVEGFEPSNVGFGDRCCYPLSHTLRALPEGFEPTVGGLEIRCLHPFGHGNMLITGISNVSERTCILPKNCLPVKSLNGGWTCDGVLRLGPWATHGLLIPNQAFCQLNYIQKLRVAGAGIGPAKTGL